MWDEGGKVQAARWRCHRCGHEMERRRPADLYQFCGHCDPDRVHLIDQDVNAVRIMAGA
jgi:Zn finger protein HypA/HybF involved in hydrogenase expression